MTAQDTVNDLTFEVNNTLKTGQQSKTSTKERRGYTQRAIKAKLKPS